ncbi:MAG: HRDC domain-containing protein [bacterium]
MRYHFAAIPVLDPAAAAAELNRFLASHQVLGVDRQLIFDGQQSLWSVCVSYQEGEARPEPPRKGGVDYKELLSAEDFAVFSALRVLRKELAEREGIPPYGVLTNEHLATLSQGAVLSLADLEKLPGVGPGRRDKYGQAFLDKLAELGRS